jgi:hypothetical protein
MMPGKDRFWLDDGPRRAPVMPEAGQADPQQAVGGGQFQAFCRRSPKHSDWVAQSQVLELEGGTRLEDRAHRRKECVRKMGMSEDYEGCVTPIRSDISTFSRGTEPTPKCFGLQCGPICEDLRDQSPTATSRLRLGLFEDGNVRVGVFAEGEDVLISCGLRQGLLKRVRNSPGARRCSRRSAGNTPDADHPVTCVDLRPPHSFL